MADSKDTPKKDTPKKDAAEKAAPKAEAAKKPAAKKAAAKKPAAKKAPAKAESKTAASKTAAGKAKSGDATPKPESEASAKKPAAKPTTKRAAASTAKTKAEPKSEPERPVVNARARYVRIAPRKARLIADQVRGLPLEDALTLLRFSPRGAAVDIAKLLGSAAANAENNHDLVADELRVSDIRVDEGPTLRRYRPRAMGRATRINKRTSHIQVALTPED
jgi:ribosomal protein L22